MSELESKSLINYTKEAFSLPVNLVFLSVMAVALSATAVLGIALESSWLGSLFLALLLGGGGLEMFYLGLMPQNRRFVRAINARRHEDTIKLEKQIRSLDLLQQLGKASLAKYAELFKKKEQINQNLLKSNITKGAFAEAYARKINMLEDHYVELLYEIDQYRKFLNKEPGTEFAAQLQKMKNEMEGASPKVKALYKKRIDLLNKRVDKNRAVREHLQMAQIQLDTLEDTVDYLLEQTITVKDPSEVSRILDGVLTETEEHHQSISEIQSIVSEVDYLEEISDAEHQ